MASGSRSSSAWFFGTTGRTDNVELMANSQQHEVSYPDADVAIIVSPASLVDPNRYVCEVCYKGFPRKQNLTLHGRAHNIPVTLKKRSPHEPVPKKVYLCPEPTCVHHNRSHALGDFGGLRKHYLRKHCTQKNFKCDTCCKAYTVESDLRAHSKICGTKKCTCHCGCCFTRGNNFTAHQENCNAPEPGAAKYPQMLNTEQQQPQRQGSVMSHPPTLGMGDNSIQFNSNENSCNNFMASFQIPSIQNQFNSYHSSAGYQYQSSQFFGEGHSSLMTNPPMDLNFSNIPPATYFSPSTTHQNQHESKEISDIDFYADLLLDKIPLDNVNGPDSFSNGGIMFDPSSSLNMTQAMHNTSGNGMLPPGSGSSTDGRSYGHDSFYGYGYGNGPFEQ